MKFRLSRHAQGELIRRQIPREWLDVLLDDPQQRFPESPGKEILQSRIRAENGKMYLLRAIVAIDKEPPVIVTIYRTSKLEKYWRPE